MRSAKWALLTLIVFAVLLVPIAGASASVTLNKGEHGLFDLINNARAARGLAKLRVNTALTYAARSHTREMLSRDYFSHTSASGVTVGTRILRYGYKRDGCRYWSVGENLGLGLSAFGTPRAIFTAWMKSSAHRANLLNSRWRDIGLGALTGTYRGMSGVVMYTVDFGRRY